MVTVPVTGFTEPSSYPAAGSAVYVQTAADGGTAAATMASYNSNAVPLHPGPHSMYEVAGGMPPAGIAFQPHLGPSLQPPQLQAFPPPSHYLHKQQMAPPPIEVLDGVFTGDNPRAPFPDILHAANFSVVAAAGSTQFPLAEEFVTGFESLPPPHSLAIVPTKKNQCLTPDLVNQIWHQSFEMRFREFEHVWNIKAFSPGEEEPKDCRMFKDSAKVRFQCQQCGNSWTSMKGSVMFWYSLTNACEDGGHKPSTGRIIFMLYGQVCKRCPQSGFQQPMWYTEEVEKVVNNIYMKVGHRFYQFDQPKYVKVRREGKTTHAHDVSLCQACFNGACSYKSKKTTTEDFPAGS
ncbi:PREDICTED: uncharacterized protein LOC106821574 [Priapulus caudatus]|uniref:Uncharacterized protein LOC106821574 n=1 Tax=Priapulus caudatus TaxID=37621 RepID=A0ABM1FBW0_PRICU|nr:PREDICTED: uncharacterized protein LOC106821574 [Priapulus caudatus]